MAIDMKKRTASATKYDAQHLAKSLQWLYDNYDKVKVDYTFQRKGALLFGSGWDVHNSELYMGEWLSGGIDNRIHLACVKSNLLAAEMALEGNLPQLGDRFTVEQLKKNLEYWRQAHEDGFLYVSIDGNNSHSAAHHFIGGDIRAYDEYVDEYTSASDLSKEEILRHLIEVVLYRRMHTSDMKKKFVNMNRNTALNSAQLRNATDSVLAQQIRDYVVLWTDVFKYFIFPDTKKKATKKKATKKKATKKKKDKRKKY